MAGLGTLRFGNGDYVKQNLDQQDQFVDNRSTMGSRIRLGNANVDRLKQMTQDQALVDVTPELVLGGAPSLVTKPVQQAVRFGTHGKELIDIGKEGMNRLRYLNQNMYDRPYTRSERLAASFRPLKKNIQYVSRGREPGPVSPAYFEKPVTQVSNPGNMGSYYNRTHIKGPSHIVNNSSRQNPFEMGLTKRHEYNHNFWQKKYGHLRQNPMKPEFRMDARYGGDNYDYVQYLAEPAEINARSREMQHLLQRLRKEGETPQILSEMERLAARTEPFINQFMKEYPDEMGKYMEEGINYLFRKKMANQGKPVRDDILDLPTLRMMEREYGN